jgi:hypothetical protein
VGGMFIGSELYKGINLPFCKLFGKAVVMNLLVTVGNYLFSFFSSYKLNRIITVAEPINKKYFKDKF